MEVFNHHLYEFEKGLRNLILYTAKKSELELIRKRLEFRNVTYRIVQVTNEKFNIFFGEQNALLTISFFAEKRLTDLSPEEDFILGILLGYDRLKQCVRYLKFKRDEKQEELVG